LGGEILSFIEAAADECRCGDIELAEVAHSLHIFGVELYGAFEGDTDLDGEIESGEWIGVGGLEAVGAGKPHLVDAAGWSVGDGEFALVDSAVDELQGVVDAAEKLMGLSVTGLSGEDLVQAEGGFVEAALLEERAGLSLVGEKRGSEEEEKQRKGNADTCRRWCEHG
jgi:hypothetical protein